MSRDAVLAEVRAAREAYAKRFNYDLNAICRDLRKQEKKSGRKAVSFSGSAKTHRKPLCRLRGLKLVGPQKGCQKGCQECVCALALYRRSRVMGAKADV